MNAVTGSAPPSYNLAPSTISSQFPNGIPQVNASQISGVPSVYDQMGGASAYSPQTAINATEAYLQPQFQQQDNALNQSLANAGIVGGTSAKAFGDLGSQQQTTMQNTIQPYLTQEQQAKQAAMTGDQSAYLNASGTNVNSQNQANQYNASNQLNTAAQDSASYNAMAQYLAGLQSGNWQSQLGAQTSIAETNATNQTSAFQPNYQQPPAVNVGGLTNAFTMPTTNAATGSSGGGTTNYYGSGSSGSSTGSIWG